MSSWSYFWKAELPDINHRIVYWQQRLSPGGCREREPGIQDYEIITNLLEDCSREIRAMRGHIARLEGGDR